MRSILTNVTIDAPPAAVWRVLVDFPAYSRWNPFIRHIEGNMRVGAKLRVTVETPGRRPMTFRPIVRVVDTARELRWLGRVLMPGLFDGEHAFVMESEGGGCRLRHEERFAGILVGAFAGVLADTAKGFDTMNAALKDRAEAIS